MEYSRHDIERLFGRLNDELAHRAITGEVYVLGGAVMCLVFDARASTRDIDAFFRPAKEVRAAARAVAAASGLPDDWLNDAVKGYLSHKEDFNRYLDLPNLRVLTASPEYLFAMKCLAMRLGEGFHDEDDVRFLLRYLRHDDGSAHRANRLRTSGRQPISRPPAPAHPDPSRSRTRCRLGQEYDRDTVIRDPHSSDTDPPVPEIRP